VSSYTSKRSPVPWLGINMDRLTSAKHFKVDSSTPPRGSTKNLSTPKRKSNIRSCEIKSSTSSAATPIAEEQRTGTHQGSTLPRHRRFRKRLGHFFVHITRTQSAAVQDVCEYQYTGSALELPTEVAPIAGSVTLGEMPASFPTSPFTNEETFELEQPQSYASMDQLYAMNEPCNGHQLHAQQGYGKQEFNGDLCIYRAPAQVATPKSLPRLAVPGSIHNLPAMTYDQSPHSASTISPNTPVGHFGNSAQPYRNSHSSPPLVSPCDTASTLPWYRSRPQQNRAPHNLTSPSTPSSASSFNSTAPLSAYPQSASASFGTWPQPGPDYLRTAFPQRYQPINHELGIPSAPGFNPNTWATEVTPHQCCHRVSYTSHGCHSMLSQSAQQSASQYILPIDGCNAKDEKSGYNELQLLPAIYIHDVSNTSAEDLPPPAYSPLAASPFPYPPAACEHCNKVFTGKYGKGNLTRHVRQIHESLLGGAIHMCRFCMKTYNRADALRKHSWKKHRDEDSRPNKRRRS
jgi:hypothetical protein